MTSPLTDLRDDRLRRCSSFLVTGAEEDEERRSACDFGGGLLLELRTKVFLFVAMRGGVLLSELRRLATRWAQLLTELRRLPEKQVVSLVLAVR